ncbi:hypothetical protein JCM6882_007679 [Rhodosporidiobolus microsporus]
MRPSPTALDTAKRLLIFGGNGFVGSAVARKAVARGWKVTSISRSGKPFRTPAGHAPAWVGEVDWRAGSAFDPSSYEPLLPSQDSVVTTLGLLFEQEYKQEGVAAPFKILKNVLENAAGSRGNPLAKGRGERSYEKLNRDSAIALFRSFLASRSSYTCPLTGSSSSSPSTPPRSPFVYLSAEDIFRPFVPARYIQTKREAEEAIARLALEAQAEGQAGVRPVFVRPSLMYHPHLNPPSTLPATLLEATSKIHSLIPPSLHLFSPSTLSSAPSSALPPAAASLASLLAIPPIHVDAVGEAVCRAVEDGGREGVLDVRGMREMLRLGSDGAYGAPEPAGH